ncbi:Vitamin K-dependent gamma-carboxylase [Dyadobacter soli]|uniref:Vitamin K-dependent gamma-carboxylase n=1 Tax=Dyadobacter soli TaxID=659014 RepID=A0A1G7D8J3_9BACT|nr:HTTM domain-containing protein [Dyadobacter soli]SDE47872.1 Vitamin K-dependent gamma-carboxylase [Dyadobacter soli]
MRHFNPFYIKGKAVAPELVLAVRFLAVYLMLTKEFPFNGNQGSGRFYPLVGLLDQLGTDEQFNTGVRLLFMGGIALMMFSQFVRLGALGVGMAFLTGLLSCQICISVAHLFTGCVFLCTALSNDVTGTDLIRFQLVVLYLGADLNKVTDNDWWTGASMETLLVTKHQIASYMKLARAFPAGFLSQIMGIGVIVLQMAIAILLLRRKTIIYAMLMALVLHLPMVLLMHMTFGPFLFALVTAYGSLLTWPRHLACNSRLHSGVLLKCLKIFDFNDQISPCTENPKESPASWLRTALHFLPHPAILLTMTVLTAAMVRYGKLLPLVMLTILAFCLYAWPQRKRIAQAVRPASL